MPITPISLLPASSSLTIAPNGATGETATFYGLDGMPPTGETLNTFITDDENVIKGDLTATANLTNQQFTTGGIIEEDMTVHSAPTIVNAANFTTPGLGITSQSLLISTHAQFLAATVPNTFLETGAGNDTLVGLSGTNILDGGSGQNTYYGGSGQNTYIADAMTANASAFIGNMKSGDNVIVTGTFTSISEGITPSGLDFQLSGAVGQPTAEVILSGVTATTGLHVGTDTNNATGLNFFFVHM